MASDTRVLIVGGGIAGLAAAYQAANDLGPEGVCLVEGEHRLGGKVATEHVDGFVVEGGPDCFLAVKPGAVELCRELGISEQLRGTNPELRHSFVKRNGKLHELPQGISGLIPSRLRPLLTTRILSVRGRLRAGLEYFAPRRRTDADESIRAFVVRRFGLEAYEWLVEPLLSGIYAGDGGQLSLGATFPQLLHLERQHRSVLRAMLERRREAGRSRPDAAGAGGAAAFLTPAGGLGDMVRSLRERLAQVPVRLGVPAVGLQPHPAGYRVELQDGTVLEATSVVLAIPAFAAAPLIAGLDPELAQALRGIPFVSTATASLAFPATAVPHPLDGYGYVSPRAEGGPVVACSWTSSKFPERAPDDAALIRLFIGRAGREEIVDGTDDDILALSREELARVLGITDSPRMWRVYRWPKGMPQYVVGHPDRLALIQRRLARHPGLFLAGASYRGVGIPDCIVSGRQAAAAAGKRVRVPA